MKMPFPETAIRSSSGAKAAGITRAFDAARLPASRQARPRPVYAGRQPSGDFVDWACLFDKASSCIAECGADPGCYSECSREALDCFQVRN